MSVLETARKIVSDQRSAPAPLGGARDKDAELAARIAEAMKSQAQEIIALQDQVETLRSERDIARGEAVRADAELVRIKHAIENAADGLDTDAFGGGLAPVQDMHAVAERLRGIIA